MNVIAKVKEAYPDLAAQFFRSTNKYTYISALKGPTMARILVFGQCEALFLLQKKAWHS